MPYAYFSQDGAMLTIANNQTTYDDESVMEFEVAIGTTANDVYLDLETMQVCRKQPFAVNVSYNLIADLPLNTSVTTAEGQFIVDDGTLQFEADVPETLWLHLDHPHFVSQWISVETGPEEA